MKTVIRHLSAGMIIFQAFVFPLKGQQIMYGSNNGTFVELSGKKVYYEEYGTGVPVLMLHGGPGSITNFAKVIPALAKKFRVIAMDTPGQGRSERISNVSYQLLANNAAALIDRLGIKKCYVIGWSDGACTALILAADRPDVVSKVFVSGAFANLEGFTEEARQLWSTLTPEVVEKSWGGWHIQYQAQYPGIDWKLLINDLRAMVNQKVYITDAKLKSITSQVLLAYGDNDMFSREHTIHLHRTISGAELMILPGTGHFTFDEQPDMLLLAIDQFFKK